MVHLILRDAHERDDDDEWDSDDWEDFLSKARASQQTGDPFNPFTTDLDSDKMPGPTPSVSFPGPSPTNKAEWLSMLEQMHSTLQTSTSTVDDGPYSEHAGSGTTLTPISDSTSKPTTTASSGFGNKNPAEAHKGGSHKPTAMYAAAAMVPVVVIAILAVLVFFYLRKRKRQKKSAAGGASQAQMREMKARNQPVVAARYASTPPSPPPVAQPHYTAPPSSPPPPISPVTPQPVILGPIGSSSNAAYFTGIDTSDVVSMNDRTGLGDPFADGNSIQDEPPPPYRPSSLPPTSIAPSSRNSSLRHPPSAAARSTTNLIPRSQATERSPFDDPEDDDNVSELSGPASRRHRDAMSDVSDLSYQEEPVVVRPSV